MDTVRWGIIGPGSIAHKFANGLKAVDGAVLTAVCSRSLDRAQAFAAEYGAVHCFESYDAIAGSDAVDAVYVATPHPFHSEPTRCCLEAGRAVLCEKPFAVNAAELEPLVALARAGNVFLMEAMWTRFLPVMAVVRDWIDSGRIGEPRIVQADFGFRCGWNPEGRLLNPALAGGSLLDVGVYTVSFADWVFGAAPTAVTGVATIGETGVDEEMAATLQYAGGQLASVMSAVRTATPQVATVFGTEGRIQVGPPFWQAGSATLSAGGNTETVERPFLANGYEYEAIEVGRCLREGLSESPTMPLDASLAIMRTLDGLRSQWGLRYPFE
jgi:dihydrodiol dehydrogenase / D-xylose 1-dehydrogenase (NADP)